MVGRLRIVKGNSLKTKMFFHSPNGSESNKNPGMAEKQTPAGLESGLAGVFFSLKARMGRNMEHVS